MSPYLTRKYISTMRESQKSQGKKEPLVTKTSTFESNAKKEPKTQDRRRMKNTRVIALKNSLMKKQIDLSTETMKNDHKENEKVTRRKIIDKKETKPSVKVVTNNSLSTDKQELKDIKRRRIKKTPKENVHNFKQTLLRESFLNQSKKKLLHVEQKIKSSQNDLTLIKQYLLPKKQNSKVLLKKLNTKTEKMPIYKGISPEHSIKNTNDIYEFNFDVNDSKERLPKKKRRVNNKKTLAPKEKKIIFKKYNVQKVMNHKTKSSNVELQEGNVKFINVTSGESDIGCINKASKESIESINTVYMESNIKSTNVAHKESNIKPLSLSTSVTFQEIKEKKLDQSLQANISIKPLNVCEAPLLEDSEEKFISNKKLNPKPLTHLIPDRTNTEQAVNSKPEIVSIQDLSNQKIIVTNNSQISKSNDFKPFRPTNIFHNKLMVHQKNTFNNSLFEKSLSPIAKVSENNEFNSPWRVPPLCIFSQVRNVFQSTPQNKKYEISRKTFSRVIMNESKNNENAKERERGKDASLRNNENVSLEGHINANYCRKKNSTTSRKFGTEITNIDHSVSSNVGEEISERTPNEIENVQSSNMINTNIDNFSTSHNIENIYRVNCVTNSHSPKKVVKIDKNKIESPQKIIENKIYDQKENLDPQPGPSGLQKNTVLNQQKNILRQSNLNNFLNIIDMPQSTSFKTAHGIFDDSPITPISAKPVKQSNKSNLDVKNAFGFSDDDSSKDISFVKHKISLATNENQKKKPFTTNSENNEKPFATLSMNEIQNKFLVDKPLRNIKPFIKNIKKIPLASKQDIHIDTSNFSDTFDVLSEMGSSSVINTSEVPLFIDPEPSHFTQPPKHSYKRKRNVKFNFSDEECEEEERFPEIKRKKADKMKKNQDKRLIEWVENINKTFDEIDQYELLIE